MTMAAPGVYNMQSHNENIAVNDSHSLKMDCEVDQRLTNTTSGSIAGNQTTNEVPLNTPWSFWIDKSCRGLSAAEYEANLKKVYTVSTVQAFWSVFNNIPDVTEVSDKHSYHLMRYEHRPLWEDKYNSDGGMWRLKIKPQETPKVWKELLLAAIGEQFSENIHPDDEICGISVSIRDRDDIVQIWNKDASLHEAATVLEKVHSLIPSFESLAEFYKPHQTHVAYEREKRGSK